VIIGAGPHSNVIVDMFLANGEYTLVGLVDSNSQEPVLNIPVIGNDGVLEELYKSGVEYAFVALGSNRLREKLCSKAERIGFQIVNAISPHCYISPFAVVGKGVAVMAGAVIQPRTVIGDGDIVNTNASVDHDCVVGDFSHIAPGCAVSGSTFIGSNCLLGTGSRVIDGITIGNKVTVGAGAAVVKDLPDGCTAVGVPAKVIKYN